MADNDDRGDRQQKQWRRRMLMARIEAGYGDNMELLRRRIAELGYDKNWSIEKLYALESGQYSATRKRAIRVPDIKVLAEACGVSEAFFYVDFSELAEPDVRDELAELRQQLSGLRAAITEVNAGVAQNARAMREHRVEGHPKRGPQGGAQ